MKELYSNKFQIIDGDTIGDPWKEIEDDSILSNIKSFISFSIQSRFAPLSIDFFNLETRLKRMMKRG